MRSPFTGIVFALELTHDVDMFLPLLIAAVIAHGFTVLVLKRSILTEKVARRGYHLSREYSVDPLETLFVREAMRTDVVTIPEDTRIHDLAESFRSNARLGAQGLYPVLDSDGNLTGVLTRTRIMTPDEHVDGKRVAELAPPAPVLAYPDEPLRVVVYRMAETGLTRLPVVERDQPMRVVGLISLRDLLAARARTLDDEQRRERVLRLRLRLPIRSRRATDS